MVNAIFCAHGKLACAMLESVQMVYGDAHVEAVEFVPVRTPMTLWQSWKS